jgi:hypothetical protein
MNTIQKVPPSYSIVSFLSISYAVSISNYIPLRSKRHHAAEARKEERGTVSRPHATLRYDVGDILQYKQLRNKCHM